MKLLDVNGINTYYGKSHILHDVTLDVLDMAITVLIGRNGAGKTTTLKSIMGILPPSSGRIAFRGNDITGWPSYRVARLGVGYIPEGREIFPRLSVGENLTVAQREYDTRSKWNFSRIFSYFPRLQERWNQKGWQLSGGEQQMLAIARALVTNPELILLDEPSQGLAPLLIKEVGNAIINLKQEKVTMLLVEQNTKIAGALADNILIITKGDIVYKGDIDDYESKKEELGGRYLSV
jgi:branched-chain amino acid transport system ATP-binding protein